MKHCDTLQTQYIPITYPLNIYMHAVVWFKIEYYEGMTAMRISDNFIMCYDSVYTGKSNPTTAFDEAI